MITRIETVEAYIQVSGVAHNAIDEMLTSHLTAQVTLYNLSVQLKLFQPEPCFGRRPAFAGLVLFSCTQAAFLLTRCLITILQYMFWEEIKKLPSCRSVVRIMNSAGLIYCADICDTTPLVVNLSPEKLDPNAFKDGSRHSTAISAHLWALTHCLKRKHFWTERLVRNSSN